MKMQEIIDKVSILYRDELRKVDGVRDELYSIIGTLDDKGEDVTLGEYKNLIQRKEKLIEDVKLIKHYCDGISCVRELLMDLGFNTKVDE